MERANCDIGEEMSKKAAHLFGLMQHGIAKKHVKVHCRPNILTPYHVIFCCLTFFVSLMPGHFCVLGYDNVGENHHAFHSIRGAKVSRIETRGDQRDESMIKKHTEVGFSEVLSALCIALPNTSSSRPLHEIR